MASLYDFSATTLEGQARPLADYRGKAVLVVNTASECGFTPQYAGLQALHERYREHGFAVLGFPCNQFGGQEPGSEGEIAAFCTRNFGVSFPMFAKVEVKGRNAHPLYRWLTREAPGILGTRAIKWNFTKFLVGRDGAIVRRYAPRVRPESIAGDIERALGAAGAPRR